MPKPTTPISDLLPPLIFGCASFNTQHNLDPYALDTLGVIQLALDSGLRAFDTSPYYGPSETLTGAALTHPATLAAHPRDSYLLLTKVGRVAASEFDYSPAWIRQSVARSLQRLRTPWLDVVYCHDVEYVSADEVMDAVRELRRIRDEDGTIKYVGISGYPLPVLAALAQRIRDETGEPLDIVQSYCHFTLQNTRLASEGIAMLRAAGVDVITNASVLSMGLLRTAGLPVGGQGDWHPSPAGLRLVAHKAAEWVGSFHERLEIVAMRYALEKWLDVGAEVGGKGDIPVGKTSGETSSAVVPSPRKLGVSVIGVSTGAELMDTLRTWRSILVGMEGGVELGPSGNRGDWEREWSLNRRRAVELLAEGVREMLGEWVDKTWDSPPRDFVNSRNVEAAEEINQ